MKRRFLITGLLLCCSTFSAYANDDLQRYLPNDQVKWLNASADSRYLALYLEPMVSFARGQIVSIPDWHLHPLQSVLVQFVYQQAPDWGWHSWSLVPPATRLLANELAESHPKSLYPTVVEEAFFEPYYQALGERLQRLHEEFDSEPGFNIWVIEGISAAIAVKLLRQQPELMPDGLVVIDMYLPQRQLNIDVSRQLATLQLPLLEVISHRANHWVKQTQQQRRQYSQKYQQINYRQRQLLSSGSLAAEELQSTLKGWLKHHGF